MKIAIVGCGYIGSACAGQLRRQGHYVTATTTSQERLAEVGATADKAVLLTGDDVKTMTALVKEQDCVIVTVGAKRGGNYSDTYLKTAETLTKALKRAPTPQQVIYTSSASVYGDSSGALINENHPVAPQNPNSVFLCLAEQTLLTQTPEGIDVCILRLGEIYGPGRDLSSHIRSAQRTPLPGNGENITNLIHRDDVLGAISFAIDRNLSGIYNLCNDVHISRRELYTTLASREGLPHAQWDATAIPAHGGNRCLCNKKIQSEGYQIKVNTY